MSTTVKETLLLKPDAVNSPLKRGDLGQDQENLRVFVFGTCNVAEIIGEASLFGAKVSHILWQPVETLSKVDTTNFDLGVLAITFRDFIRECGLNELIFPRLRTAEEAENFLAQCYARLSWYIEQFAAAFPSIPVFVPSFLEPSFGYQGILIDQNHPASTRSLIRKLNEKLSELLRSRSSFHYIETNEIISAVGRTYLQDDVFLSLTHNSIIREWNADLDRDRMEGQQYSRLSTYHTPYYDKSYGYHFWSYIFDAYRIVKGTNSVKLVIVDLDDTLWRGVAGEANDLTSWERKEGWPIGFVEALLYFKSRGGMLAICSKNDHDIAARQMEEIWGSQLSLDDFASVRINRRSKVDNIREILAEINVLPDSAVFIDDNPREIAEVSAHFPDIRCVSGNHFEWRRIVLRSPEMQVPMITGESVNRTELIQAKIDRDTAAETLSREDWLKSLEIELSVFKLADCQARDFTRCFELLNKTNQFNTTGKRWTLGEMQAFFDAGGAMVYASLKDRTVDNGIIGVTLVQPGRIEQAVLSCRVFGLGAETGMGHFAVKTALALADSGNVGVVSATIQETGKNFTCLNYFESLGFVKQDGMFEGGTPSVPDWIRVNDSTHADAVKILPRVNSDFFPRRFEPREGKIRSSVGYMKDNTLISNGTQGFLMYGPYIALSKGRYQASIGGKFSCTSDRTWTDVCANMGDTAVQLVTIDRHVSSEPVIIEFELTEDVRELEIRLHIGKDDSAEISFLEIKEIEEMPPTIEEALELPQKDSGGLRSSLFLRKYYSALVAALGRRKPSKTLME